MKEGWKYKPFGEAFPIKMGKTPPRGDKSCWDTKKESDNKWVSISDISQNEGKVIFDTKEYITDAAAEKIFRVKANSLLMSFKLTIGKMAFAGTDLYTNEAIIAIPENKEYNLKFLYFYLSSYNWSSLTDGNEKVKGKTLNKESIGRIKLPIISLPDQQRIVSYLDAEFAKIEALKANAEKQLQAAKDLFQAALKELLTPKEGWVEKKLGEVTSNIGDGLHGTPKYSDSGEYYFINGNNLENGSIEIKPETKRINKKEYDLYKVPLNENSVLLSINGTIGKTAFYDNEKIILGKSACYINVLSILKKEYLRYFIMSDYFNDYTHRNVRQATIKNLGLKEIRNMPIIIPPLPEQQRIADRLDALSANVKALQTNYAETITLCNDLKQALLKNVFG